MNMKVLLACLVFVVAVYEANAACNPAWLLPPDDEPCEPDSSWDDMEECKNCSCDSTGYIKDCCDMGGYPVINDTICEKFRNEECEWVVRGKEPEWDDDCHESASWVG